MTRRVPATWLALPSLLLAGAAQGQSGACEQLKARLATGIEATGVRGYSLEVVPSAAPVPRDGKVIGNCEAGARKVVYRRWGGAAATAAEPAAAPPPPPPPPPPAPAPVTVVATPAPAPEPAPAASEPAPAPQPAPLVSRAPLAASVASAPPLVGAAESSRAWPWLWLAAAAVLLAGGWLWRRHFSAYDGSGLPRGPRL